MTWESQWRPIRPGNAEPPDLLRPEEVQRIYRDAREFILGLQTSRQTSGKHEHFLPPASWFHWASDLKIPPTVVQRKRW